VSTSISAKAVLKFSMIEPLNTGGRSSAISPGEA
jgi:hypothetical protein